MKAAKIEYTPTDRQGMQQTINHLHKRKMSSASTSNGNSKKKQKTDLNLTLKISPTSGEDFRSNRE